jgi:hypothetical protein
MCPSWNGDEDIFFEEKCFEGERKIVRLVRAMREDNLFGEGGSLP